MVREVIAGEDIARGYRDREMPSARAGLGVARHRPGGGRLHPRGGGPGPRDQSVGSVRRVSMKE